MRRVLLATDLSPTTKAAFERALAICHSERAQLHVLHANEYPSSEGVDNSTDSNQLYDSSMTAEEKVSKLVKRAAEAGVQSHGRVVSGRALDAILKAVDALSIDLVILSTRGVHGFERLVFGSTAEGVIREAKCPVITVGPHMARFADSFDRKRPTVFATDFHRSTTQAIRSAAAFARQTGSDLHCLHVLPRSLQSEANPGIIPRILSGALEHVAADVCSAAAAPVCAIEFDGEISHAIVKYAEKVRAGLIVLGVRRVSLLAAHLPAHIAYRVITDATCPVLTVAFSEEQHGAPAIAGG